MTVSAPLERTWSLLTDLPLIAPCMPGAELVRVDGEDYHGVVKVKVGPIAAAYKGTARFVERDAVRRRAVLRAQGRDSRGQGNASATVSVVLSEDGDKTLVDIHTDLVVSGKVAQFGRSVMADVSAKLLTQFAERLETTMLQGSERAPEETDAVGSPEEEAVPARASGSRSATEAVDLLDVAGASVLRRVIPVGALALTLVVLAWSRRRRD